MGKKLIIVGADFSDVAAFPTFVPHIVNDYNDISQFVKAVWNLTDTTNELQGKTIAGFDVKFTNIASNATLTCSFTFGSEVVNLECSFDEGQTEKTMRVLLNNPFTFGNQQVIAYEVTGNVTGEHRGGCDFFVRDRDVSGVAQYAFTVSRSEQPALAEREYMPFVNLLLLV